MKLFESKKNKNPVKWKGIPFWIGIVDLIDGEVISTWSYETAESHDFNHSFYMNLEYLEKIDDGEYGIFWFKNKNKLDGWDEYLTSEIKEKIYKQII